MKVKKVKENKIKNKLPVLIGVVVILMIGVFGVYSLTKKGKIDFGLPQNPTTKYSPELERLAKASMEDARAKTTRPNYFPNNIMKIMFGKIDEKCKFPENFYEVREMYRWNWIDDSSKLITECHWKQPEWTEDYETRIIPLIGNPPEGRTFISTPAVFPAQAWITIMINRNRAYETPYYEFDRKVWVYSGALSVDYLPMGLMAIYPEKSTLQGRYNVQQKEDLLSDTETAKRYIQISFNPNEFILEPSFPIYEWDYKKLINVHISIDTSIPDGIYMVGFETTLPSKELDEQCIDKYGLPGFSVSRRGCMSAYHSSVVFQGRRFIQFVEIKSE